LYCLELNKERFNAILAEIPEGAFRTRIEQLLAETNARMFEIQAIIKATISQLPTGTRMVDAVTRTKGK
jgi:hypothetical protein